MSWYDEPDDELSDDSERRWRDAAMSEGRWPPGRCVAEENVGRVPERWQRWICSGVVDDQRLHERVDLVTIRMFIDAGRSRKPKPKRNRVNSDALKNNECLTVRSQRRRRDGICRARVQDELGAS